MPLEGGFNAPEVCCRRYQGRIPSEEYCVSGDEDDDDGREITTSDFDRRLPGRQSLDSSLCRHHRRTGKSVTFKHYSDEFLNRPCFNSTTTAQGDTYSTRNDLSYLSSVSKLPFLTCRHCGDYLKLGATNDSCSIHGHCCERTLIGSENTTTTPSRERGELIAHCERERKLGVLENSGVCTGGVRSGDDLRLEFASDVNSCRCEQRTSVSVLSSCKLQRGLHGSTGPHSAPVTPSGFQPLFPPLSVDVTTPRHRAALSLEPAPPYLAQIESQSQRPFTRVNLTLRPPSSDPQPPIDIRSTAGGGLTYSTCSYDPRQGYQSQLRISIGPGGQGSVSAARKKSTASSSVQLRAATSMPDVASATASTFSQITPLPDERLSSSTQATVNRQLEKKRRLEQELQLEKERLKIMQQKVADMEKDLRNRRQGNCPVSRRSKVQELKDEIVRLRAECKFMTAEVDLSSDNPVPLGETREDFYRDKYRGPEISCLQQTTSLSSHGDTGQDVGPRELGTVGAPNTDHHRPPETSTGAAALGGDGPNWTCYVCTFRNHPLLDICEQCDMPRIVLGTPSGIDGSVASAPHSNNTQLNPNTQLTNNNNQAPNIVH